MKPKLSIIIPAHNEETVISKSLEAILKQKGNYEMIVVNDGSTDKTKDIVEKYIKKFPKKIKLINFKKGHSAAFARNRGSEKASGDWLIFIDADHIVEEKFIQKVLKFISKNDIDGTDFIVYSYKPKTIIQKAWSAYRHAYPSIGLIHIIKKSVFKKLNGFDESIFYYEDTEFRDRFLSKGYKFKGPIDAIVYHIEPESWKDFIRQRKWQSRGVKKSFKDGNKIIPLRYFLPVFITIFSLIIWWLLPFYMVSMSYYMYKKSKKLKESILWSVIDLVGRFISLFYFL